MLGESPSYPVSDADVGNLEVEYASDAVRSTWVSSSGPYLERFEEAFASACGTSHALAVSNGTVALHLILAALGVGPGDEVIVPSLTYVATANAVTYVGASPVFCDVSVDSWCLNSSEVEDAVTSRTVAVIAVHLYGHPADMDDLRAVCARHGLALIEDAAEAPFATYRGCATGSLGLAGSFSFYGNKVITSGEGGAVTTNDHELAAQMRLLRGQGMDPQRRYFFPVIGYNFRLTNVAAALLCAQMERRKGMLRRREGVFERYETMLAEVPGIALQHIAPYVTRSPWLFTVRVTAESPLDRNELAVALGGVGVDTRPMFVPVHSLPPYVDQPGSRRDLPVTEALAATGLSLPTSSTMSPEDASEVALRLVELMR